MVAGVLGDAVELVEVSDPDHTHPGREGKERLALWRRRAAD
jgi:hypothetical protein